MQRTDFIIIGAGIMGLALARELKINFPNSKIIVLEKEDEIGKHASGRNSGVLHSGIYYPENSLKAKLCAEGAKNLADYCDEFSLPINRIGKIIVPLDEDNSQLDLLYKRAILNGATVELINESQLKTIEPAVYTVTGKALYSPNTAVIDSKIVLDHISQELKRRNVDFIFNSGLQKINEKGRYIIVNNEKISFGHLFNAAGLHADRIARICGAARNYTILPFKGIYYRLDPSSGIKINRLIYPVPDLSVPFLGVHFTKTVSGEVMVGPTAIPAFGRENYGVIRGLKLGEAIGISRHLLAQYIQNKKGFRTFANNESLRFFKSKFTQAAQSLVPTIRPEHLLASVKVGIRAQLYDLSKKELVMDFLVENTQNSTHILNAVSPAFTSSFAFSKKIIHKILRL